jgi:energy-coupling factor transporter ATP-binding protein EcfA2
MKNITVKITGQPGCGKTTLRQVITDALDEEGVKWSLMDIGAAQANGDSQLQDDADGGGAGRNRPTHRASGPGQLLLSKPKRYISGKPAARRRSEDTNGKLKEGRRVE